MNSKLTRERLQEIAEDGFLKHGESKELARMALTAMDSSESVAEVLSNRPGNDTSTIDRALPVGTKLYRHAQPAPVVQMVPEEPPEHLLPKGNSLAIPLIDVGQLSWAGNYAAPPCSTEVSHERQTAATQKSAEDGAQDIIL